MNNSETWVSHTPSAEANEETDLDEDFVSATEPKYSAPSPPNAFEKFFLPFENGEDTSTFALAASRFNNNQTATPTSRKFLSSRSITSESILTEDFASAVDNLSITSDLDDISLEDNQGNKNTLFNDILGKQTIFEETPEEEEDHEMARSKKTKSANNRTPTPPVMTPVETPAPTPAPVVSTPPKEDTPKFDVVENVYEGAKSVWAFGKGIIVFKPFMGVAEGAATKVLSVTTGISTLEDADKHIKSTLSGVDKDFIDPAILKLWSVLEPIVGKGDEVLKTVLGVVSKKVPMIEGKTPEVSVEVKKESEEAIAPETSTPAVIA